MPEIAVHDHPAGVTWTEVNPIARSWHALASGGRVWLVDPVNVPDLVERAQALGEVVGVLQLLDRHERDSKALADLLEVPLERLPTSLPGTPWEPFSIVDRPKWREVGLWNAEERVLVVPEAVGAGPAFALGEGPAGVHPLLRLFKVEGLRRFDPEVLLMGHGAPVADRAGAALSIALDRSRGDIPKLLRTLPGLVRGG